MTPPAPGERPEVPVPIDDTIIPGAPCECQFTPDPDDPNAVEYGSWHYLRRCEHCRGTWWGLHCPHDLKQNPCINCGQRPTAR